MKRKLEELRLNLDEFVQQTDYSVLAISCAPNDCPYVASLLEGRDLAHPQTWFLVYPGAFASPEQYMASLVAFTDSELKQAAAAREERGEPPLPALPASLSNTAIGAAERFVQWLKFLASLLPDPSEHSFVVALLPAECADPSAYVRLAGPALLHGVRPEWLQPLRVVVVDSREAPELLPVIERERIGTVLTWELDLSPPALVDAMVRECADPRMPVAERMASVMQLAAIDVAYGRFGEGVQKFAAAFEFYSNPPIPSMQALCMQGAGEALAASGDLPAGKRMLERGLLICMQNDAFPSAVQVLHALVRVCFQMEHYPDAEAYAKSGSELAAGLVNPALYAHLLERKGDAQLAQAKRDDAVASYEHSRRVAEYYLLIETWEPVLEKLVRLYDEAGMSAESQARRDEHARMSAEKAADPARAKLAGSAAAA